MKEIVLFAGTTEGRRLSEYLSEAGVAHTVCVATEYGKIVLEEAPGRNIHCGRMNEEQMESFLAQGDYSCVVDATHPYATEVTENIRAAAEQQKLAYFRLKREEGEKVSYEKNRYFENNKACAEALKQVEGNILLTTGSKELSTYCACPSLKERLYVRVLPGLESLQLCMEQGIVGKQILALQGPFSEELNKAILQQFQIRCLVTKDSGRNGGFQEKLKAAKSLDIPVFIIGHPQEQGDSFSELCEKLTPFCGKKLMEKGSLWITLAGIGMGSEGGMTEEVKEAVARADILLGAERLIEPFRPKVEKKPFYLAKDIIPYLDMLKEEEIVPINARVVILFSGDSGFYSGCQKVYQALKEAVETGKLSAKIEILPGISCIAALAASIGVNYEDGEILSIHGREMPNLTEEIRYHKKTFLLLSGVKDLNRLGKALVKAGLEECEILAGYQMSYPEQEILSLSPAQCIEHQKEGLYTCCILNREAKGRPLTHGHGDGDFIRAKVPMTKEEVREVSICKLKLREEAVVYDIGSGTGSIAVEMAALSNTVKVYALEQKPEAAELIRQNKEAFHLENIEVIETKAPDGMDALPAPTHAFIGGSGGKLREILDVLYQKNSRMRVVINAISLETISQLKGILAEYPIEKEELVQLQVSRAGKVGGYHLMQAENPVWICAFYFR